MSLTPQDVVAIYLRAQNLEQVRKIDDAVALYEEAVAAGFDSAGPYDRLIAIYRAREAHGEVVRIATIALANVRTFEDKRRWYEQVRKGSENAVKLPQDHRGAEF